MTLHEEIRSRRLPELLLSADNTLVQNANDWKKRREEIKQLLCKEYMGIAPENVTTHFELTEEDLDAYGGKAINRNYQVTLRKQSDTYSFPFRLILPKAGIEPLPVFLHLHFTDMIAGGLGEEIIDNGYALAHVCYQDITPDISEETFSGLCGFDPEHHQQRWGKIAVWAFGASRIMDCLQTLPELDHSRVALIGHSRLGLTTLWCAAMDERFSLAAAINSGSLYRGSCAESFRDLAREYTRYWFCPNLFRDNRDAEDLPFDMHFLLALIAPRHVYLTGATRDLWTDSHSQVLAGIAAGPAFALYGKDGLICPDQISADTPYHQGNIAFYLRSGTHYLGRDDWHAVMNYRREKQI